MGLQQSGFSVFSADSGIACIEKLEQVDPDLLLLDADFKWGGCDGVLALVETSDKLSKTPVIVLASHRTTLNLQAIRNFTVCDILVLPLPMATISQRCVEFFAFRDVDKEPDHEEVPNRQPPPQGTPEPGEPPPREPPIDVPPLGDPPPSQPAPLEPGPQSPINS